jgi:NMD protein affecting ribosome stability and mRNA decay
MRCNQNPTMPNGTPSNTEESSSSELCGICSSSNVHFDAWLDINLCAECGSHQTAKGWQERGE